MPWQWVSGWAGRSWQSARESWAARGSADSWDADWHGGWADQGWDAYRQGGWADQSWDADWQGGWADQNWWEEEEDEEEEEDWQGPAVEGLPRRPEKA